MHHLSVPKVAIVRDLPQSFVQCIKEHEPEDPIDLGLAKKQHDQYVELLKESITRVVQLPADEALPDSCFIEDTAVVIGDIALINFMGAPARRGEEVAVKNALAEVGISKIVEMQVPGTLDGGDVLYTGRHIFVGISKRTNEEGARQLEEAFGSQVPVITIPVLDTLHLKSVVSAFDSETLIFAANSAGQAVFQAIKAKVSDYQDIWVPDTVAANVLLLGNKVVIQKGYPISEAILSRLAEAKGKEVVPVQMSELIKGDSALTCCSILI